jgi:adenylate cyclase
VLDRLRDGQGGLIALEGEPGAGKSRLLAEFRHTADRDGCTTIATAAHEIECATAYFAFRRVLRRLLWRPGDPDDASPVTPRQRLVDALAETGLSPRAALVEDILPLGIEDLGLAAQIRDAARRAGVEDILVALFVSMAAEGGAAHGRAGKGKMLLLVDDLQWIDALSADLLLAVSRRVPDLLIVAASRPIDPDGAPHGARVLRRASQRIALCRLDAGPTAQMIAELLKVRTIPRRLAEFVHEQSEGLPFHAEQLTLSLLQLGLIEVADGRCRVVAADIAKAVVPNRLRDIIVSRIDGLSQTGQLAAKVASVIGRVFELDALREIFPMRTGAESLDESIRGLVRAGILEPAGGTAFAFHHVITQEATYDLLSFAQRRSLHRLVAQGIERRNAAVLQPHFAELAHHWEHAEDTGKALDFRLEAANLAIRRHANDDALMHIDRAERLAARTGFNLPARRRAQIEYVRGEAFHALSRFPEAAKHFGTCLDLSGIRRPATPAQMAVAALGQIGRQGLHRLGLMRRSGNPSRQRRAKLSARVYTRFAEHAYFTNNTLMLVHGTLTALNQAESIGSAPETVEAYGALAIGLGTAGLHGAARYYRDRSISLAEQAGELTGQGVAQLFAAVYSFQAGNWEAVRAHGTKGSAIFERLGDRFRHQSCRVLDCYTALATGDFARAAAGLAAFGPAAEAVDNAPVRAWVLSGMSILDMLHGRSPERTIERMEAAEDAGLHASERLLCDGLEAMARLNMGDIEAARRVAARALERMRDSVCTMGIALFSVCAVAEVHLALVEQAKRSGAPRDGALIRAHEACRAVTRYAAKTRICRPRAHLLKGRLALLNGETTRAAAHFRRSLTEAHILGMPLEEAISQLALARSVRAIEDRRIHAARGAETMRMLGAAPWGAGFWGTDAEADEVGVENRAHYKLDYDETVRV